LPLGSSLKVLVWKQVEFGAMSETEKEALVDEVNLLRDLQHPNIVRYYDRIIDREAATLYIIMELCEGGDLSTFIRNHRKQRYVDASNDNEDSDEAAIRSGDGVGPSFDIYKWSCSPFRLCLSVYVLAT
jgi:serine/threonine protein kinase